MIRRYRRHGGIPASLVRRRWPMASRPAHHLSEGGGLSLAALLGGGLLLLASQLPAQTLFTDVTEEVGLDAFPGHSARNVVFVDYDNDGHLDVFFTENAFSPRRIGLFHNTGDGRFVDQTFRVPFDLHLEKGGSGGIFGDWDNDGDEDLFLPVSPHNVLLRNDRGVFTEADPGSDLSDSLQTRNAIWLDYDLDGYLDLYVGNSDGGRSNRLLRNNGDGTFADQTAVAGLDILLNPELGGSRGGMAAGDFNDDGWPDLYVGVFGYSNRLFLNDGQGGFQDVTTGDIADDGRTFCLAIGDTDNDGDLDIFQGAGTAGETSRSQLLLNLGEGQFLDVTESVGLGLDVLGTNTDGTAFADFDNDGDLDLAIARARSPLGDLPLLLLNDGSGSYVDQTATSGLEDFGPYAAVGDYDEDGFVDLLYASLNRDLTVLYRNNGNGNHWLRVELVGIESNRNGIGTRLLATSGDLEQMREILGGLGRQEDERVAHFGLGARTQVDRLEIRWPSGQVGVLRDIPADQKIRVFEGREGHHVVRPSRWEHNLPDEAALKSQHQVELAVQPELYEPNATITQVTANLGELGGPADLPLRLDEDGVYRRDTSLEIDVPRGAYTAFVDILQHTSLGDHWVQLSKTLTVMEVEDTHILGRTGEEDWTWHGQDLMRVTHDPAHDIAPLWSPDGTRLTFITSRDDNWEVYVIDTDGSNPVNLTNNPAKDYYPSWSPDGTKIVFRSDRDENPEIYVMDADGSNPTRLTMHTKAYDSRPSWSADGTKIVFYSNRVGNSEIYGMDADGGNPIRLTNHDAEEWYPALSPDGRRIAFLSQRDGDYGLYVLDRETGNTARLTQGVPAPSAWSPDGTRIAFYSDRSGNNEIYAVDVDGGDPAQMTAHPAADGNPAWSPNGSQVAFESNRTGHFDLFILSHGGASRVEIDPEAREPVFADGEGLAVRAGSDWWLSCQPAEPFDWAGYGALGFSFHPGELSASTGQELSVWINGNEVDLLGERLVDLTVQEWQVVELPFERFTLKQPIRVVDFCGDLTGTFYLDDVRLVAARPSSPEPTAVVERTTGIPLIFALQQNYPNPFNSNTAVRFSLPQQDRVGLTLYNLAGQQVATLATGTREAGIHTIRWDGRDDDGRRLASGLYLYRLHAGDQVATRKLVLLR